MSSGLISGLSSGAGQALGTGAAGSAAGQAAATTAGTTAAGRLGYGLGQAVGGAASNGAAGDLMRLFESGPTDPSTTAGGTGTARGATSAADPKNTKGGWLGMGLFGNDQFNPNPSSYAPAMGNQVAQAAMPKAPTNTPIALQLLRQLPITDPSMWRV